jgi:hypothetical protein
MRFYVAGFTIKLPAIELVNFHVQLRLFKAKTSIKHIRDGSVPSHYCSASTTRPEQRLRISQSLWNWSHFADLFLPIEQRRRTEIAF